MSTRIAFCLGLMVGSLLGGFFVTLIYAWSATYLAAQEARAPARLDFAVGEPVLYKPLGREGVVTDEIRPYESYRVALATGEVVTASYRDLEKIGYPAPRAPLLNVAPLLIFAIGLIAASSTFYLSKRYWGF